MHHHITGINQCPGCKCTDKTIDHFLQCPHPEITAKWTVVIVKMRATGIKMRIPKDILNSIVLILTNHTSRTINKTIAQYKQEITTAIQHQEKIGIDMLARGFISKQWLFTIHPSRNPTCTMTKLQ